MINALLPRVVARNLSKECFNLPFYLFRALVYSNLFLITMIRRSVGFSLNTRYPWSLLSATAINASISRILKTEIVFGISTAKESYSLLFSIA